MNGKLIMQPLANESSEVILYKIEVNDFTLGNDSAWLDIQTDTKPYSIDSNNYYISVEENNLPWGTTILDKKCSETIKRCMVIMKILKI